MIDVVDCCCVGCIEDVVDNGGKVVFCYFLLIGIKLCYYNYIVLFGYVIFCSFWIKNFCLVMELWCVYRG